MAILPEHMEATAFANVVAQFRKVVGDKWVLTADSPDIVSYYDNHSPAPRDYRTPSAVVMPDGIEQIQKILEIANAHQIPLWTYGNGKNIAYGGPAPLKKGYVVLDIKRMNRILEVNEELGYALVEPGVSYFQLYQHIQEKGLKLWIDCPAPGWGGVIGNALEHGAGYTPYADHLIMQCGMEVVLADGTVVRTGMGALPGNNTWQLFKYGFGPWVDWSFSQGNFGIVTKMGIWLMPEPPAYKPFMVTYQKEDDLHALMEILRPLKLNMVIPNGVVVAHLLYDAAVQTRKADIYQGKGPTPDSVLKKLGQDLDLGIWNAYGALYGLLENVEIQWQMVQDALSSIPGAKFYFKDDRKGDPGWEYREQLMRGVPNMGEFGILNWVGGGHINFTPIGPMTGDDAMKLYHLMREVMTHHGFDYIAEFAATFRALINILMVLFDHSDQDAQQRAHACSHDIIVEAAKAGYGELKANLEFMDLVAGVYNYNDNALLKLNTRIKDALDPQGIFSPGKSGIWPKHMRKESR
jgi:4-cresol dehydrogenase (hydroxylating)